MIRAKLSKSNPTLPDLSSNKLDGMMRSKFMPQINCELQTAHWSSAVANLTIAFLY